MLLTYIVGVLTVPIGTALGVYGVGTVGDDTGDSVATWIGSASGGLLAGPIISQISTSSKAQFIGTVIGSAIVGTLAFNLTREHEMSGKQMISTAPIALKLITIAF